MYWLFGTLVYLDAKLPRPECRGEGLGLPPFKEAGGGKRVTGGAGGEWEEGKKCKFLNGRKNKNMKIKRLDHTYSVEITLKMLL